MERNRIYNRDGNKVLCGSIFEIDYAELLDNEKAYILYTDPPWNDGNIKYWYTINKKQTGINHYIPVTYIQLLNKIKEIIDKHVDGFIFIEGSKYTKDIMENIFNTTVRNLKFHNVLYKSGSKYLNNIIMTGTTSSKYKLNIDLNNIKCDGLPLPKKCITHVAEKGKIVLDPFCGLGNTARATLINDMTFIGTEINSLRLERTWKILEK